MTNEETKAKFNSLTEAQKKSVNRESSDIKRFGANHFFIETGCHVDKAGWQVVAFAMTSLGITTEVAGE